VGRGKKKRRKGNKNGKKKEKKVRMLHEVTKSPRPLIREGKAQAHFGQKCAVTVLSYPSTQQVLEEDYGGSTF